MRHLDAITGDVRGSAEPAQTHASVSTRRGRPKLASALIVIAAVGSGCRTGNTRENNMSQPPVSIVTSPAAKGADRMSLSADGRWMALEYRLSSELPLVVRIDRRGEKSPLVGRGLLAGPPRADGAVFYVEQEASDMRTVLSSPADERRSHLRRLGTRERLLSLNGAFGAWPAGDDAVVMFGGPGGRVELTLVSAADGSARARHAPFTGLGSLADATVAGERLFLLFNPPTGDAASEPAEGLTLVALATADLRELWRRDGIAPAPLYQRPSLGVDADRVLIAAQTSELIASFKAATGAPDATLAMPPGKGLVRFMPAAQPTDTTLIVWAKPRRGANSRRGWQLLRVRDDSIERVADRPDELPPAAGAWDGEQALLAPFGPPRSRDHIDEWEAPFVEYMKLADHRGL
ncbi:MAG: hypothetical protein Tsb0020_16670 [Haliangiales bacterium]